MKNKKIYIGFIIIILSLIISYFKIDYYVQKNNENNKNIIRYGKNIKVGDIININGNKEKVIKILEDGYYITKIIE